MFIRRKLTGRLLKCTVKVNEGRKCEEMVSVVQRRKDKVRPRSVASRSEWIDDFKWKNLDRSPYFPDLAPSEYIPFLPSVDVCPARVQGVTKRQQTCRSG